MTHYSQVSRKCKLLSIESTRSAADIQHVWNHRPKLVTEMTGYRINIQIKIALSRDKVRILIKSLAENHIAFDLGDEIDIRWHTDRESSPKE